MVRFLISAAFKGAGIAIGGRLFEGGAYIDEYGWCDTYEKATLI